MMQAIAQSAPFGLTGLLGETSLGAAIGIKPVCFAEGTRILTDKGYVEVQRLQAGDVVVTAGGAHADVRWLGHRQLKMRDEAAREKLSPVRIRAGALAENTPLRDLFVSPNHALFLDGVLVSAISLVNGLTVTRATCEEVSYYHVECDEHRVLVSEGAASESYLDTGARSFFANADLPCAVVSETPETAVTAPLAAPRATREQTIAIRKCLRLRAEQLGGALSTFGQATAHAA